LLGIGPPIPRPLRACLRSETAVLEHTEALVDRVALVAAAEAGAHAYLESAFPNVDGVVAVAHTEGGGSRDAPPHNFELVCRTLAGFVVEEDPGLVLLRTADGRTASLPRASIDDIHRSPVSIMPAGLLRPLDDQQVRDLFAYLRSTQPLATK
jgi:altronate dehydratase